MKKLLALILALAMVLSLTACGTKDKGNDEETGKIEIVEPTDKETGETKNPSSGETIETTKPDDITPDGEYVVDFKEEKIVYEHSDAKITFVGMETNIGSYDKHEFTFVNNFGKDIYIMPNTAVINGRNIGCYIDECVIPAGEAGTLVFEISSTERTTVAPTIDDIKCIDYSVSVLEVINAEEYEYGKVLADNLVFSLTDGQHNHKNDEVVKNGRLVFENDEIAFYVDEASTRDSMSDNYAYTIVNKTDKLLKFDMTTAEYGTTSVDFTRFTNIIGGNMFLAPHTYNVGTFMLYNTKYEELTEVKITINGEYTNASGELMEIKGTTAGYNDTIVTINTKR
jgi:hypothetical protein